MFNLKSALSDMKELLKPLNIYNLDENSYINYELTAYAAGIDVIFKELNEFERELFLQTAQSFGLTKRLELFKDMVKDFSDTNILRDSLLILYGRVGSNFKKIIFDLGIDADLLFEKEAIQVNVNTYKGQRFNELKKSQMRQIKEFISQIVFFRTPVIWQNEEGETFKEFDNKELTCEGLDCQLYGWFK